MTGELPTSPAARQRRTAWLRGALGAAIVLGSSACSGGAAITGGFTEAPPGASVSGGPGTATSATAASAAASSAQSGGQIVKLSLTEYRITPATVTAKPGVPITIVASNAGSISHALFLTGGDVNVHTADFAYQPGQAESVSVTLVAGTYTFFCPVDGHRAQGMVGTLIVAP